MKYFIKQVGISVFIAIIISFSIRIVYAAVITPSFPTTANNFSEGDVIEEEDWNALENTIGITSTTSKSTLHGKWNDLFASTTMPQLTTLLNVTSVGTIGTGVWQGTDVGVQYGGTGVSGLTDGGVLFGSGTGAITASSVLSNGQLLIGDNSTDPALATLTGTTNEIDITNGAGSITLSLSNPMILSNASTTLFSIFDTLYVGGTATTTLTNGSLLFPSVASEFSESAVQSLHHRLRCGIAKCQHPSSRLC